jgi:hypothetical protein
MSGDVCMSASKTMVVLVSAASLARTQQGARFDF